MMVQPDCDHNCNECPIIGHPNSRLLTLILDEAYSKFGIEFAAIVQKRCPNLTCCHECRIDNFVHFKACSIQNRPDKFELITDSAIALMSVMVQKWTELLNEELTPGCLKAMKRKKDDN